MQKKKDEWNRVVKLLSLLLLIVSFRGLLTWYLIESGSNSLLSAAAVFCSVWNPSDSVTLAEANFVDRSIYVYAVASALRAAVSRYLYVHVHVCMYGACVHTRVWYCL